MNENINKYFALLYPNEKELNGEERYYAKDDKSFISENIEAIHRKFQDHVSITNRTGEVVDEQEIMKNIFDGVRRDYYYKLLHPNVRELSGEERYNAAEDKSFISENIEAIHRKFQDHVSIANRTGEVVDEQEIMKNIFDGVRRDYYYKLLHPNVRELSGEERYNAAEDKSFIYENIEAIHRKFCDYVSEAEITGQDIDKQKIMQEIITGLRTKKITTQQIGQATINAPTTAKKEAEQVENAENTRDNIKEGEEVGDDN